MEPDPTPTPDPVSDQPVPARNAPAGDTTEATVRPVEAAPAVDGEATSRDGLWIAFLLGVALLLALCAVLALVASSRAPVGAPG